MKIARLLSFPKDNDTREILVFLIQSIDPHEYVIDFLISIASFYNSHDHLTDRQRYRMNEIIKEFNVSLQEQYPEYFVVKKDKSNFETPRKVKGFTVYDGGKR